MLLPHPVRRDGLKALQDGRSPSMIGIVLVACLAAQVAGVPVVTITSTCRRTSSAARSGSCSTSPSV